MRHTIVVAGALAQKPYRGGHTWVFLQYLLGFKKLGWSVLFVDAITSDMCVDSTGARCAPDASANLAYTRDVMTTAGLQNDWSLLAGDTTFGVPRKEMEDRVRSAAFLLNVNGYLRDETLLAIAQRRVFLDIDPGVLQMWHALGLHDAFAGHDDFVTIARRLGEADCPIPSCGRDWIATAPPVVLDSWPVCAQSSARTFTSVASWRGAFAPIEYGGRTYGQRVHEFRKFVELPRLTNAAFEIALDIHPADARDAQSLASNGWALTDPLTSAGTPSSYRSYVQESGAEFMVAKGTYVDTQCGWISDRSVCYLASGKPVVAQDTGLRDLYPGGDGLALFSTLEQAASAVRDVEDRYAEHATAARRLAERHFDSDKVLSQLLARLGLPERVSS
jgi:hypothetical protein